MEAVRKLVEKYARQGKSGAEIFKLLANTGVSRGFVYYNIKKIHQVGSTENRPRTGRPRTVRRKRVIKTVHERI